MDYFRLLAISTLILLISCGTLPARPTQDVLADVTPSIVKLLTADSSCTAFHIGHHKLVTANHCIDTSSLLTGVTLIDYKNKQHEAKVIYSYKEADVAILYSPTFNYKPLKMWSLRKDSYLKKGMPILTAGYPGYYDTEFIFEMGYIKDLNYTTHKYIVSKETVYRGESGGPVISLQTGKVIGMVDALIEKIDTLSPTVHQHNSLSLISPFDQINVAIARSISPKHLQ